MVRRKTALIQQVPDEVLTGDFIKSCFNGSTPTSNEASYLMERLEKLSEGFLLALLKNNPWIYEWIRNTWQWEFLSERFKGKWQLERLKMGIMDEFVLPLEEWTEEHYWSLILNLDLTEIQDLPSKFYEDAGVFQSNERRLAFGSLLVGFCMLPTEDIDHKLEQLLEKTNSYRTVESGGDLLQREGLLLGRLTNHKKSYRHCRLAIQQTTEAKWFSPYHSLENLN